MLARRDVAFTESSLLVAAGRLGLLTYEVVAGRPPTRQGSLAPGAPALAVASLGELALVALGGEGLLVVSLANPAEPREISRIALPHGYRVERISLDGELAFVASGELGFSVIDLSEPANPRVIVPQARRLKIRFP